MSNKDEEADIGPVILVAKKIERVLRSSVLQMNSPRRRSPDNTTQQAVAKLMSSRKFAVISKGIIGVWLDLQIVS